MPSSSHEVFVDMFRNNPSLAARLLTDALGLRLPAFQHAEVQSNDFTNVSPTEYRADAVLKLTNNGVTVLAVVVEMQLRPDKRKHWSWPVYLSTLRARVKCPALLLVVCLEASTAAWCAKPIDLGHPDWVLTPLAIGPDQMPFVTDVEIARQTPELACPSAIAHAEHPDRDKILDAFLEGLVSLDPTRHTLYSDFVMHALPAAARESLEALLSTRPYEYQSDFVRKYVYQGREEGREQGREQGRAEERAKSILGILSARGMEVPHDVRAQILNCTDMDVLAGWQDRAVTVDKVEDLFDQVKRP